MPHTLPNRCATLLIASAIGIVVLPINDVAAGCNSGNVGDTDLLSSANCQASAPGTDSLAVGAGAQAGTAGGASDTALGDSALAGTSGSFNTAVGAGANAGTTSNNTAIGANTIAVNGSIAIGGEQTDPADAIGEHSIAIGINSFARSRETVAVGLNTGDQSTGAFNTWMGSEAGQGVDGLANSAFGTGAGKFVSGNFNIAIGTPDTPTFTPGAGSNVTGDANIALGSDAGKNVTGDSNIATGRFAGGQVSGFGNSAYGISAGGAATGNLNAAFGAAAGALVTGDANIATGTFAGAFVNGNNNVAIGSAFEPNTSNGTGQNVTGDNNIALGSAAGNGITASNTISMGTNAVASADGAIAMGQNAAASGANAIAIGSGAVATGSVALGNNAFASNGGAAFGDNAVASGVNSAAIGPGAVASQDNEVVLGTSSHSYQAPGITSSQSKSRQSGQLEIVTSDSNGNLATDGGHIFEQLASLDGIDNQLSALNGRLAKLDQRTDENESGVALAMSMQNPDLVGNERFGMAANWGAFEGANALGMSLMGVLGNNFVMQNDRVAVSGGFGVGFSTGSGDDVVGGRVGLQWTH